jgi:hypothetical protein
VKDLAKPSVFDVTSDREPVKDLSRDKWSTDAEVAVQESLRVLKKETLGTKLEARDNDVLRDRKREVFSEKVEAEPTETDKFTVRPLNKETAGLNESPNDLK